MADIEAKRQAMRERYVSSERHTVQVDYPHYPDEIARLVGCLPDVDALRATDPEVRGRPCAARKPTLLTPIPAVTGRVRRVCSQLADVVWGKGAIPAHYRLIGPGAWAGAREAILNAEARVITGMSGGLLSSLPAKGHAYVLLLLR